MSRHIGVGGRSRQTVRSVLERQGDRLLSRQGRGRARRQKTDAEQSVKAMLLDRGATANASPSSRFSPTT